MIRTFFGILIFIVVLFYLSHLNPDTLHLKLFPGMEEGIPIYTSLLILGSVVIGAFLMMAVVALRDTRKGFVDWKEKGRLKKKEKIMDLYRQGVNNLLSKKRDEALKNFEKILVSEPKNVDALLRIGEVYRYKGELNKAVSYHTQARSMAPENVTVLFALGKDYRRLGNYTEATEIYRSILKIDERNMGAFLKLRDIYEKEKDWDKAYTLQKGYWGLKKDADEKKRLDYYQFMSATLLSSENDREKKIKKLSELNKSDKLFISPYVELGKLYASQENDKEAVKIWKKGFKETVAPVFLEVLDDHYRKKEDPGSAIKIYKEAMNRHPENPVFKFLLGKFYYRLEMIDDALEMFEQLKNQGIHFPILQQILGEIFYKRGKTEEAFLQYRKSVNFIRPVLIPYSCTACGHEEDDWLPACPECGKMESLTILLQKHEETAPPALTAVKAEHD